VASRSFSATFNRAINFSSKSSACWVVIENRRVKPGQEFLGDDENLRLLVRLAESLAPGRLGIIDQIMPLEMLRVLLAGLASPPPFSG